MCMSVVDDERCAPCESSEATGAPPADSGREAAMGTLAMSLLHDLRNPLAAIHSGAEMLNAAEFPEQHVRRIARIMYDASIRIQELLQDYADLCRTMENQLHPHNLRHVVGQAIDRVATMADAQSVAVEVDIPGDLVVIVDRRQILSVLVNLLTNALESMEEEGSIQISASLGDGVVVVRVLDSGPGIPPEIRDCLFDPFVTARKPNGWGLGLAQARRVVLDHGGEMWVESVSGMGACFAFSLPLP